jgi:UDP-3-O-[3-hydroxymyristoyl] glucosamine N-acyltransferase
MKQVLERGFSPTQIASWIDGKIVNENALGSAGLDRISVERPAGIGSSRESELAFFFSKAYQHELPKLGAGILITGDAFVKPLEAAGLPWWKKTAVIACADPYLALAILSEKFAARLSTVAHVERPSEKRIHATAVIHPSAEVGPNVQIGPHCVVEDGARIGAGRSCTRDASSVRKRRSGRTAFFSRTSSFTNGARLETAREYTRTR